LTRMWGGTIQAGDRAFLGGCERGRGLGTVGKKEREKTTNGGEEKIVHL